MHIRKNVPNGKKPTERKPLQKPKPCTTRYKGIKKRLIGRMPVNLTEAEIKGRDDRPPAKRIALSIHIGQGYFKYIVCMKLKFHSDFPFIT